VLISLGALCASSAQCQSGCPVHGAHVVNQEVGGRELDPGRLVKGIQDPVHEPAVWSRGKIGIILIPKFYLSK
jgi:hypothetical protein